MTDDADLRPDADDPLGHWLYEQHFSLGEYMVVHYARLPSASAVEDLPAGRGEPEWFLLPHWRYDGLGGWHHLLRGRGVSGLGPLPAMKHVARPGVDVLLHAIARRQARPRPVPPWRDRDPDWKPASVPARELAGPHSWKVLSRAQTARVAENAARRGASVNSFLLWALDRAVRETLLRDEPFESLWSVPVNVRGGATLSRDTANHVGLLEVALPEGTGARGAHEAVRRELEQQSHWATWTVMDVARRRGAADTCALIERDFRRGAAWLGSFSNLGALAAPDGGPEGESAWAVAPPPTRIMPLGCCALTWNGRLSLAIQSHRVLRVGGDEVRGVIDRWAEIATAAAGGGS